VRLFLAAACVLAAAKAAAHAELVASIPADGAALAAAPAALELRFNEPVRLLSLRLVDASGGTLPLVHARADGDVIRAQIADKLGDGHYTLSYRITSLDSHPVGGAIAFGVGAGPPPAPATAAPEWHPLRVALRALRDLALLIAAGGALFVLAFGSFPGDRAVLLAGAAVGGVCALAGIALQGSGLHSSFGLSTGVACAGLAAIAAGTLARRRALLALGAAAGLASLPLTGHTVGAPPAMAALAAHGLAAGFWLGSLVALLLLLRQGSAAAALRRFSAFGVAAVLALLACGVALTALQLETLDALWTSPYGRLILAKSALLALLIALALVNRYRLLPALERAAPRAEPSLRRTVGAELALMAAVIAVTAVLVQTPPRPAQRELVLESGGSTARLSIGPGAIVVWLRDAQGVPLDAAEVTLEAANPAAGVEPLVRSLARVAPGHHRLDAADHLAGAGWRVTIHARIGEFDKVTFK
jgi:copper transport protein